MIIGLVGTTIAPWMQFYQQASVVEKNIAVKDYKLSRLDVIVGSVVVTVVAGFIVLTCAATLFKAGVRVETAADAAQALAPLAGKYCAGPVRLRPAQRLALRRLHPARSRPPSSSARRMGWETGVDKKFSEAPQFYGLYTLLIFLGAAHRPHPRHPALPGHVHLPGRQRRSSCP